MSFSAYGHHVRNPTLPYRHRVSALRSCVQLYRPLGFEATLSFLRQLAGPFERDGTALLRALDALAASRAGWHAELRRYAAARRVAKARGQRSPHPREPNPNQGPRCWYGAPRRGALHALAFWQCRRLPALLATGDPIAAEIDAYVTACLLAEGDLTLVDHHALVAACDTLRQRIHEGRNADPKLFQSARQLPLLAHFVHVAANAPVDGLAGST
ncbi:hypothetical protein [Amycolatopsis taiwanensis]|uniref:hypothetical protein n=1 Tax=Amycolatopsis taiwanensis TaxID=342230 RepID=UPI0004B77961|nr:hypothetical protein [Amycolatopsis taiwanensis]